MLKFKKKKKNFLFLLKNDYYFKVITEDCRKKYFLKKRK
jgi:hypothetical protein